MNNHEFRELVYDELREADRALSKLGYRIDLSSVKIGDEIFRK